LEQKNSILNASVHKSIQVYSFCCLKFQRTLFATHGHHIWIRIFIWKLLLRPRTSGRGDGAWKGFFGILCCKLVDYVYQCFQPAVRDNNFRFYDYDQVFVSILVNINGINFCHISTTKGPTNITENEFQNASLDVMFIWIFSPLGTHRCHLISFYFSFIQSEQKESKV
jgi:hypothetical protein